MASHPGPGVWWPQGAVGGRCVLWRHLPLPFPSTAPLPLGEPRASRGFWAFLLPPPALRTLHQPEHLTEVFPSPPPSVLLPAQPPAPAFPAPP